MYSTRKGLDEKLLDKFFNIKIESMESPPSKGSILEVDPDDIWREFLERMYGNFGVDETDIINLSNDMIVYYGMQVGINSSELQKLIIDIQTWKKFVRSFSPLTEDYLIRNFYILPAIKHRLQNGEFNVEEQKSIIRMYLLKKPAIFNIRINFKSKMSSSIIGLMFIQYSKLIEQLDNIHIKSFAILDDKSLILSFEDKLTKISEIMNNLSRFLTKRVGLPQHDFNISLYTENVDLSRIIVMSQIPYLEDSQNWKNSQNVTLKYLSEFLDR